MGLPSKYPRNFIISEDQKPKITCKEISGDFLGSIPQVHESLVRKNQAPTRRGIYDDDTVQVSHYSWSKSLVRILLPFRLQKPLHQQISRQRWPTTGVTSLDREEQHAGSKVVGGWKESYSYRCPKLTAVSSHTVICSSTSQICALATHSRKFPFHVPVRRHYLVETKMQVVVDNWLPYQSAAIYSIYRVCYFWWVDQNAYAKVALALPKWCEADPDWLWETKIGLLLPDERTLV